MTMFGVEHGVKSIRRNMSEGIGVKDALECFGFAIHILQTDSADFVLAILGYRYGDTVTHFSARYKGRGARYLRATI